MDGLCVTCYFGECKLNLNFGIIIIFGGGVGWGWGNIQCFFFFSDHENYEFRDGIRKGGVIINFCYNRAPLY